MKEEQLRAFIPKIKEGTRLYINGKYQYFISSRQNTAIETNEGTYYPIEINTLWIDSADFKHIWFRRSYL